MSEGKFWLHFWLIVFGTITTITIASLTVGLMQPYRPNQTEQTISACKQNGGLPSIVHKQVGQTIDINGRPQPDIEEDVQCEVKK